MRILEICTSAWPQPEMQSQIDALRDAFSADTTKPFQLKQAFPFSSASPASFHPSPPMDTQYQQPNNLRHPSFSQVPPSSYPPQPITPPVSAGLPDHGEHHLTPASSSMMANSLDALPMTSMSMASAADQWNPTPIFQ